MTPLTLWSAGLVMLASAAAAAGDDPLGPYRDRSRVLAVVAPDATDPRLAEQRKLYTAMHSGAGERDLVLVEGIGKTVRAAWLRRRFGVDDGQFRAVLIGKDGGDKLSSATPLGAGQLFPLIDSMPMRQEEMRQDEMRRRKP